MQRFSQIHEADILLMLIPESGEILLRTIFYTEMYASELIKLCNLLSLLIS